MQNKTQADKHKINWAMYVAFVFLISLAALFIVKFTYLKDRQLKKQYQKDSLQYMKSYRENIEMVSKGTNPKASGVGKILNFAVANLSKQYMMELILGAAPKRLEFNQADVAMGTLEYEWTVNVDVDGDRQFDFCFSIYHRKGNNLVSTGDLKDNTLLSVLKFDGKSWVECKSVPFTITVTKNVVVFVVNQSSEFKIGKGSILKANARVEGKNASQDESSLFTIR